MKKIIIAIVACALVVVSVKFFSFSPVSAVEYDGKIINSAEVEEFLTGKDKAKQNIALEDVKSLDKIYRSKGQYYVGEDHKKIDLNFPMYFNKNTGLYFLSDQGTLYDDNFDTIDVVKNMAESDGTLYTQMLKKRDDGRYLFLAADSGIHMNMQGITIKTESSEYAIPLNSIIKMEKDNIRSYCPEGDHLHFLSAGDVNEKTTFIIDGKEYNYYSILKNLGIMQEKNPAAAENANSSDAAKSSATTGTGSTVAGSSSGSSDSQKKKQEEEKKKEEDQHAPTVTVKDFSSTVYTASSTIEIEDPSSRLNKGRVELQILLDGKIYARKYLKNSQSFTITGLEPDKNYNMIYVYKYKNLKDEIVEVKLDPISVSTKALSTLTPVALSYENGEIQEQSIALDNISLLNDLEDESINNISKMEIRVDDKTYSFRSAQIRKLIYGESFNFETDKSLKSNNDDVRYEIQAYDSFGNELPMENYQGSTKTCKQSPKVKLRVLYTKVAQVKLGLTLENPDEVDMQNYRIEAVDSHGTVLADRELRVDETEINFTDLDAGEIIYLTIYADFDKNDGHGLKENVELISKQISTSPITSLGRVYIINAIQEIEDNYLVVDYSLEGRTNDILVQLIDSVELSLKSPDGTLKSVMLDGDQLSDLKEGKTVRIEYSGLESMTEYEYASSITVVHGTKTYHDFATVFSVKKVKTLRRIPEVEFRNWTYTSSTISVEVRVGDPDETISGGYAGLRVRREDGVLVDVSSVAVSKDEDKTSGWIKYELNVPDDTYRNRPYKFEIYALEYNRGYKASEAVSNKLLVDPAPTASIPLMAKANIGIEKITEYEPGVNAKVNFDYTVKDDQRSVRDGKVIFKILKDGSEYGDPVVYVMETSITSRGTQGVPLEFILPLGEKYTVQVWVTNDETGNDLMLAYEDFDTNYEIKPITHVGTDDKGLYTVANNPSAHYIVLNDLDVSADPQMIDEPFKGCIDFNGHKVTTVVTDEWKYLFKQNDGELKNIVLESSYENTTPIDSMHHESPSRASSFMMTNNGTVSDVMLTFKGTTALANDGISGLINQNSSTGVLKNFVINATGALHTKRNSSYCVAENSGTIMNGYVYGQSIDASYDNDVLKSYNPETYDFKKRVGCVAGYNISTGKVSNVFSIAHVKMAKDLKLTDPDGDFDELSVGNIIGLNSGKFNNGYSYGEEAYVKDALAHGPVVGENTNTSATNSKVYYVADGAHTNSKLNVRTTKTRLYDEDFQTDVLNGNTSDPQFSTDVQPVLGYYPHVNMDRHMPGQELIPLPAVDSAEGVDIKSVELLENTDDEAQVKIVIKNSGSGDIMDVDVDNISTVKIDSFEHIGKITNIYITISNPKKYLSQYGITQLRVKNNYGGTSIVKKYSATEHPIYVDFYYHVKNADNWMNRVYGNTTENYKIDEDIDFTDCTSRVILSSYSGKLDGQGHTLSNISAGSSNALIGTYTGKEIRNITIDGISGTAVRGMIASTTSSPVIDHVFVRNLEQVRPTVAVSAYYAGGLIAYSSGTPTITNCGVDDITFLDVKGTRSVGGLIGWMNGGTVTNCYASNLYVYQCDGAYTSNGTGGLIGYTGASTVYINDCYAHGNVEGYGLNFGGLLGNGTKTVLTRCYTDVNIAVCPLLGEGSSTVAISGIHNSVPSNTSNVFAQGNYTNRNMAGVIRRFSTGTGDYSGKSVYASAEQLINGKKSDSFSPEKISGLLTYRELCSDRTLRNTIGLGDAFDYSGAVAGYMPRLKDTNGELLPGQVDIDIKGRSQFDDICIETVNATDKTDVSVTLIIKIAHASDINIKSVEFDHLKFEDKDIRIEHNTYESIVNVIVRPEQYKDVYYLTSVKAERAGESIETEEYYKILNCRFYKYIEDYDDWKTISNNNENYKLAGDIDFEGKSAVMPRNFKVNRFEGLLKSNNTYYELKNINLQLDGKTTQANTANVFSTVSTNFENVRISNFSISFANPSSYTSTAGFIYSANGTVKNVDVNGMSICKPSNGTDDRATFDDVSKTKYCSYVGFIVTGNTSTNECTNIHINKAYMVGTTYVGALMAAPSMSKYAINVQIENSKIYATSYAGAIRAQSGVHNCTVKNCQVVSSGGYAGALVGYAGGFYNNYVDSCTVRGYSASGGVTGFTNSNIYYCAVRNSNILSSYSNSTVGGICGTRSTGSIYGNYVDKCTITSTSGAAGGISGSADYVASSVSCSTAGNAASIMSNVICNSEVKGAKAGGVAGVWKGSVYDNCVRKTDVTASDCAGGLIGAQYNSLVISLTNNLLAANVNAKSAGGVVGRFMNQKNKVGLNRNNVGYNILQGGTISGTTYAGGLAGEVSKGVDTFNSEENDLWKNNMMISATIERPGGNSAFQIGNITTGLSERDVSAITGTKVHNSVKLDGRPLGMILDLTSDNFHKSINATRSNFTTPSFYTSRGLRDNYHSALGTSTWQIAGYVDKGYMPISGMSSVYAVQVGNPTSWIVNGVTYKSGTTTLINIQIASSVAGLSKIAIPSDYTKSAMSLASVKKATVDKNVDKEYTIYPVAADKINIEFENDMTGAKVIVNNSEDTVYEVQGKVVTVGYNFSESMNIKVDNGENVFDITVDPSECVRRIMLHGDCYYYINADGVLYKNDEALEGEYIHLYDGKGMKSDGAVVDFDSMVTVETQQNGTISDESIPLQSFEYNGGNVRTYAKFTDIGDGVERDMQLFCKDGKMASVAGSSDNVKDSIFFDTYQDKDYQVVLGNDGKLYDLKTETVKPEAFENSRIRYMASNVDSNSHCMLVEYESGAVYGFDYITGEEILKVKGRDVDLFSFVKDFASSMSPSLSNSAPAVYSDLHKFELVLKDKPVEAVQTELGIIDGDDAQGRPDVSLNRGGSGAFDEGSQYISYYDTDKSEYVLYNTSELMNVANKDVKSENEKISASPELANYYATPSTHLNIKRNLQGFVMICIAVIVIVGAMLFLAIKKSRMESNNR